jgi:hypothetical protein
VFHITRAIEKKRIGHHIVEKFTVVTDNYYGACKLDKLGFQ